MLLLDAAQQAQQAVPDVNIVSQLWGISPLLGLMAIAVGYLVVRLNAKEKEIKELNANMREYEKDSLLMLEKVANTLDKVIDFQEKGDNLILKEIDNLKQIIMLKNSNKE